MSFVYSLPLSLSVSLLLSLWTMYFPHSFALVIFSVASSLFWAMAFPPELNGLKRPRMLSVHETTFGWPTNINKRQLSRCHTHTPLTHATYPHTHTHFFPVSSTLSHRSIWGWSNWLFVEFCDVPVHRKKKPKEYEDEIAIAQGRV